METERNPNEPGNPQAPGKEGASRAAVNKAIVIMTNKAVAVNRVVGKAANYKPCAFL